jgi:hypothetical protein
MSERRSDHDGSAVAIRRIEVRVVVDHDSEARTGVVVRIPRVIGLEPVAIVAEEPGVIVGLAHVIAREVEAVGRDVPVGDQGGHVVVHGLVRVRIDLSSHPTEVPATVVVGVREAAEVQGLR